MELLITLILAVLFIKYVERKKPTQGESDKYNYFENKRMADMMRLLSDQKLENESLKLICAKYEEAFGKKEALKILTEIETNNQPRD